MHEAPPREASGRIDLARSTWSSLPGDPVVLVPTGSTEQHGPHLPFTTDTVIAHAVAHGIAETLGGPIVVAPALAFGASGEHEQFAGTLSIGHDALRTVLVETVRSLDLWASRIIFVNGHGGNVPTLHAAVAEMRDEGHDVSWVASVLPTGDAHAGRTETSLMLHLDPASVRLEAAEPGNTTPMSLLMPRLVAEGVRAVAPNGVLGDPTGASADEGRAFLAQMVAEAVRRIRAS